MSEFTFWVIASNLLLAARWTLLLSAVAFVGGGIGGMLLLVVRIGRFKPGQQAARLFVELFQGTPLLMQLFLFFFGLPLIGVEASPWMAAAVCLTLYASAFLTEIWRGCVEAIPRGQWDAGKSLGLRHVMQLRLVILPQALRIAIPPTVGFLVQLVKSTALASIVGYHEMTRTAQILTNATFQPFLIFGLVALIYFAICFPLTYAARRLERRLGESLLR